MRTQGLIHGALRRRDILWGAPKGWLIPTIGTRCRVAITGFRSGLGGYKVELHRLASRSFISDECMQLSSIFQASVRG
jgi:hypothetical protein